MTDHTPDNTWPGVPSEPPAPPTPPPGAPEPPAAPEAPVPLAPPTQPYDAAAAAPSDPTQPYGAPAQQPYGAQPSDPTQPYGAQPTQPYGAAPEGSGAAPGGPIYPGGPGNPGGPGAPVPPKKKGLPGWALALIIGGGVLLIGLIVGVVIAVSAITGAFKQEDCSAPGSCGQGLPPTSSEEAPVDPSADPGEVGSGLDDFPLDRAAVFASPPVWAVPFLDGWDIETFDESGINKFSNSTLGCIFVTSQNGGTLDSSITSDRGPSESLMTSLEDQVASSTSNSAVVDSGSIDMAMYSVDSGQYIEFVTTTIQYTTANGDFTSEFIARSMPASGGYMWAQIECATPVYDAGDSPFVEATSAMAVVPGF